MRNMSHLRGAGQASTFPSLSVPVPGYGPIDHEALSRDTQSFSLDYLR